MRKHLPPLGAVLAVAVALSTALPAAVQAVPHRPYVNPFSDSLWEPSRTDMGMDWGTVVRAGQQIALALPGYP
jgi:hypothetical protein